MYQFQHPFSAIVAGPSGCGKSYFIVNFIKNMNDVCDTKFENVIWFYDEWQPLYKDLPNIKFQEGLPSMDSFDGREPNLIIIDDLMREANSAVVDIFTKGCHHRNLSVFFLTQNVFHQGKGQRDISLNAHYIVLFKNPRDKAQIKHLTRQVYPENPKFLEEAYNDATSNPHGYLLFDLKQGTPDIVRFRTSIFNEDGACYIYIPKKRFKYTSSDKFDIIQS
ncbi:hypothetical protein RN001_002193 [Aquatica leii]|uniref:Uncharacterized protein n=1 Tax=Aquatica leii TaxID=1421715 RepID=A0AAN7Q8G2_9COLE|nr:hypothetical protein RN001_002193 [Aquatica leii]